MAFTAKYDKLIKYEAKLLNYCDIYLNVAL
uniref:Uncharacterized protein n=1 Tax=Anguilla anguilla TaxID=7936 RepID=A0A0E9UG51_ANGAN